MKLDAKSENYDTETEFIYGKQSWGAFYAGGDGDCAIDYADNQAARYIEESLQVMKISENALKTKSVFNIGSGREARVFYEKGARHVTHFDISRPNVENVRRFIRDNGAKNFESMQGDIERVPLESNKYDIIFLAGVYQHIEHPGTALVNLINMLKPGGIMYLGFYRSGEWKYFIVDAIRHLIDKSLFPVIKDATGILYTLAETHHYQMARLLDDFFVPCKHNFHPHDVIHDIELLGGEVYHFDQDFREYHHEGSGYFSIGGDRIYVTKNRSTDLKASDFEGRLKTVKGKNQLFDVPYKEDIIKENIELIQEIRQSRDAGHVSDMQIALLAVSLYQFTRPFVPAESEYYQMTVKYGRHETLNKYLKNFLKEYAKN